MIGTTQRANGSKIASGGRLQQPLAREVLERCARELLARETLDEHSIRQLTQGLQLESPCHGSPTAGAIASSVSQGATS